MEAGYKFEPLKWRIAEFDDGSRAIALLSQGTEVAYLPEAMLVEATKALRNARNGAYYG